SFNNVDARLYKGKVTGSATAPLQADTAGSVNLRLEDADVGALSRSVKGFPIRLDGRAGGKVEGELTPAARAKPPGFAGRGDRESRLWEALNIHNVLLALQGTVDFDLTYQQGATPEDTTGTGRVQITNVRYGDIPISGRLAGDVRLRGQQLFLPELSGSLGD